MTREIPRERVQQQPQAAARRAGGKASQPPGSGRLNNNLTSCVDAADRQLGVAGYPEEGAPYAQRKGSEGPDRVFTIKKGNWSVDADLLRVIKFVHTKFGMHGETVPKTEVSRAD